MRVLVTGGAGSIGVFVVRALLSRGDTVSVVDSFNDYYDVAFKRARLVQVLAGLPAPQVFEVSVVDEQVFHDVVEKIRPECIIHLAAWASIRPSVKFPLLYTRENIEGTVVVLQTAVDLRVPHVVFASSSSVYGGSGVLPFREDARCDTPTAPYPASKRAGELYASMYHHLYGLSVTCLRFFTVYGPWIRPDMAVWKFTERIFHDLPVTVYRKNAAGAVVKRDFTFVDDIVRGVVSATKNARGFDVINLGNNDSVPLERLVRAIETACGKTAVVEEKVLAREEDVVTAADITRAREILGFQPAISIEEGAQRFVQWYGTEFLPAYPRGLAPSKYYA